MKLKVPVNSYMAAVKQIEAGADEIYMGLEDDNFNRMSYSARAKITSHNIHSNLNEEEFKRIVDYAHKKHVQVDFTANCQHISNSENNFYKNRYIEYVKKGVNLGADALIVADIGNIISLRKNKIMLPIIAGSYLEIFNCETVNFFKELGVFRVCIPDQITFEEITEIKRHTDLEVEIFIGYGCSNIAGSCNFCHNSGENVKVGVTCKANFKTEHNQVTNIIDACPDCAICSIPKLYEAKIDSLKIIGRESNFTEVVKVTKMYKSAIEMYKSTGKLNKEKIICQISWWKEVMCPDRCKYENSGLVRSYI